MKPKICKTCKNEFEPIKAIQPNCFECTISKAKRKVSIEQKREKAAKTKELRAKTKAMAESIKTYSDLSNELQIHVNKLVRLIDEDCLCISSGKFAIKKNAGHFFARSIAPYLRFHLFNIWLQSEYANTYLHGDLTNYGKALDEMGLYDFIQYEKVQWRGLKLSKDELRDAIQTAKLCVKQMEESNKVESLPRTIEHRILLRKKYNTLLSIYK